jgi:hypothetical protein
VRAATADLVSSGARLEQQRVRHADHPAVGAEDGAEHERLIDVAPALQKSPTGRSAQCPACGSSRRPKTDGESKRGTHHQSIEAERSTSAQDWQSDTNP